MADIKVSELVNASVAKNTDAFMIVQDKVSKKITLSTLLGNLNSLNHIKINPEQNAISTSISSKNSANMIYVDGLADKVGINTDSPTEKLHVMGNVKVGSANDDGVYLSSYEFILHPTGAAASNAPISILRETTGLNVYGTSTYTLGNGLDGQMKYIYFHQMDIAGSTASIDVPAGLGFTTISMTAVGQGLMLQYLGSKWICLSKNGATLT